MKLFKAMLVIGVLAAPCASAYNAQALTITPSTGVLYFTTRWEGTKTDDSAIEKEIHGYPTLGNFEINNFLYRSQTSPVAEEGPLKDSYATAFDDALTAAKISYDGGDFIGPVALLLIKDGQHNPAWYLFNLTLLKWDGKDTLYLQDFWVGKNAISYIALYGTRTAVPEASTMLLLGAGLVVVAVIGRKKFKK